MSLRGAYFLCGFLALVASQTTAHAAGSPKNGAPFGKSEPPIQAVTLAIEREAIQRDMPNQPSAWTLVLCPEIARILLWGGVIFGSVVIVLAMRDALPGWGRSRLLEPGAEDGILRAGGPDAMAEGRLQADELARVGAYAAAMHVLLLRSFAELRDQLKVTFADSLTSREILRLAPLDDLGRAAFSEIVHAVEGVVFGEARADETAYQACRESYEALRGSLFASGGA